MISLQEKKWAKFTLSGLGYEIINSKAYHKENLEYTNGKLPYITRTHLNNGLTDFVVHTNQIINPKNTISFGAENADFFYQPFDYITGNKMYYIKAPLNKYQLLFIQRSLSKAISEQFSFGYGMIPSRVINKGFMLPIKDDKTPDYEFMEQYMITVEKDVVNKQKQYINKELEKLGTKKQVTDIKKVKWKEFKLKDVFPIIQRGKRLKTADHIDGNIPYVSSTSLNNGVDRFIGNDINVRIFRNCLSLANSGSVGSCFYEPFDFVASDHITHLKNDKFNKFHYLFISSLLNRLSEKYNFNREINDERISREKIILPVKNDNTPDYDYMEQYTKNIMIEKYNRILEFINR